MDFAAERYWPAAAQIGCSARRHSRPSELGNYVSADTAARETARNEPATPEMIEPDPEIG